MYRPLDDPLADPFLHDVMAYCGPRGVPFLHFMGGPPGWDPESRRLAIAWSDHERTACRGCGTHPDDWDESRGGDRDAYIAVTVFCHGDELLAAAQRGLGDRPPPGMTVALVRNLNSPRWRRDRSEVAR